MNAGLNKQTVVNGDWTIKIVGHGEMALHVKNMTLIECALKALRLLTPSRAFALPPELIVSLIECNPIAKTATMSIRQPATGK
jgi:hypothetical protein